MSPQPSRIEKFPQEATRAGDNLVFSTGPQSSLVIPKAVIAQLWAQVTEGTRILARGGLEVGGLLVGPKAFGDTVVVDEIIPLPIEYRHGPSFHMSSSDLAAIPPAMESVQEDQSKAVVGLYRGRTRGDTTMRQSDHEILDAIERVHPSFAADFRCFLVLAPMSESMALACIAMRDGSGWDEMPPIALRSNPLSIIASPSTALQQMSRKLQTEELAIHSPVPSSAVHPLAEDRVPERRVPDHSAASLAADRTGVRRGQIWLYAAACLVAVVLAAFGAYRWARRQQPQPAPIVPAEKTEAPRAHLGFSASREGPVWKLSWDRAVMDTLNPVGAVLSIEDGGYLLQLPLAPADLASGILFYTPQSNDLTFGLRIDRGGSHVEEQVRVLAATRSPLDRAPQPGPAKAPIQARADAPAAAASTPVSAAARPPATTPTPTPTQEPAAASRTDRAVKSFSAPAPLQSVVAIAVPVPPPNITPANPDSAPSPALNALAPVTFSAPAPSRSQPAPAAAFVPSASPVPSTPAPTPIPPAAAPAPAQPNYVGPRPIQQVRPAAPAHIPPGVTQVEVLVDIDAHGKVTKVNPAGETAANASLMISAAHAASSWVFAPAQLNGHAVPSQMNLIFKF